MQCTTNMDAPPHCSSPRLDHVLPPRRGYSQRLVYQLHLYEMLNRHYFDLRHLHFQVLVVWWCPVRQSLNLLAFYPLNMKYNDDRNCHITHGPGVCVCECVTFHNFPNAKSNDFYPRMMIERDDEYGKRIKRKIFISIFIS